MDITETTDHPPTRTATDPSGSVLRIDALRCAYGSHEAVRGIDLDVQRGEVFALLGTNGAGKTTTLETLEGHRSPTDGRVRVLGCDPARDRRRLAGRMGVMFQEPSTPDELTPAETLALWMRLSGAGDASPDGVTTALERVDLDHRRDVTVGKLSGGERRRLDLAVALSTEPELLLLDEPTTGLDPESRARTWQTIREVVAGGATVLLTTHYLEEAEALAHRLAIMHDGQIAVSGSLDDVLSRQPARIRCVIASNWSATPLPDLEGSAERVAEPRGDRLTITTPVLQRDLTSLLGWAERHQIHLERLQATEPSLAEVFHTVHNPTDQNGAHR